MAMKPSIQLKLGQSLTMTPQLQQAIRLLQLSSLELQTEIQEALEGNMVLEMSEENPGSAADNDTGSKETAEAAADAAADGGELPTTDAEVGQSGEIPEELPTDSSWDDIYDAPVKTRNNGEVTRDFDVYTAATETLDQYLLGQINLLPLSDTDQAIAMAIIDSIDGDGFLTCSIDDILQTLGPIEDVGYEEVHAVLSIVQSLEPAGVGARDLNECLLIQLRQRDQHSALVGKATQLVSQHLDLLAAHDFTQLMRVMGLKRDGLQEVINLIQELNPRPCSQIASEQPVYVIPDVFVRRDKNGWKVELNGEVAPRLRINPEYAALARGNLANGNVTALKNHIQEARWFLKSLQSRSDTLLRVARCIVERQQAFLEEGDEKMQPLVLHDIAEAVEMHESTISRVTTRKYMHTPRGIYELKYFFSSHVGLQAGGECSSTAIRAMIKKLVAAEDTRRPLSDSKLSALLGKEGINVARRTVAKYRDALGVASSSERKQLN